MNKMLSYFLNTNKEIGNLNIKNVLSNSEKVVSFYFNLANNKKYLVSA